MCNLTVSFQTHDFEASARKINSFNLQYIICLINLTEEVSSFQEMSKTRGTFFLKSDLEAQVPRRKAHLCLIRLEHFSFLAIIV